MWQETDVSNCWRSSLLVRSRKGKGFYWRLKTIPPPTCRTPPHLQKIRSTESPGERFTSQGFKHDQTSWCTLCDFKSSMIFWIVLEKNHSFLLKYLCGCQTCGKNIVVVSKHCLKQTWQSIKQHVIFNRSIREFSQGCDAQGYFYAKNNKFEK